MSAQHNPECHVISLLNKQKNFFLPGAEARVGAGVGADWFVPGADENQTAPKNPGSALAHRYIPVVSIKKITNVHLCWFYFISDGRCTGTR